MSQLKIGQSPISALTPSSTIQEAAELMTSMNIGAVVVLEKNKLVGIISERDVIKKVISERKDPIGTLVKEVMTRNVKAVKENIPTDEALRMMHEGQFRHLPVVDEKGAVLGMFSVRDLLRQRIEELNSENKDLTAFISADGPGG